MLSDIYVKRGLDAMARIFSPDSKGWNGFVDGHRAAGMISAWFLCNDGLVEERAEPIIARALDGEWMGTPLFAPYPEEDAIAPAKLEGELDRLALAISACLGTASGDPHPVIFPSLALKALRRLPACATPARVAGVQRMVQVHAAAVAKEAAKHPPASDGGSAAAQDAASGGAAFDPEAFSTWALGIFADGISGYVGNWPHLVGHVLTYSAAVLDLHEAGYAALGRKAERGLRIYAESACPQPWPAEVPADVRRPAPRDSRPELAAFWAEHPAGFVDGSWAHAIKYPYGYLQLLRHVRSARLRERLRSCAYGVLDWYLTPAPVPAAK